MPLYVNGNARAYVEKNPRCDRLSFVSGDVWEGAYLMDVLVLQIRDAVQGLIYLHGRGIVHGDIKGVSSPLTLRGLTLMLRL
jgi:hypothetical protein